MSESNTSVFVNKALAVRKQIVERHLRGELVYERDMAALAHEIALMARLDETFTAGQLFNTMGAIEFHRGHFIAAYDYVTSALRCFEQCGVVERIVTALNNLGEIHRQWGKYEDALKHYGQAYRKALELENWELVALILSNIGLVYLERDDAQQALDYFNQALAYSSRLTPRPSLESETYSAMARAYLLQNDLENAHKAAEQALSIGQQYNRSHDIAQAYRTLGIVAAHGPASDESPGDYFAHSRSIYQAVGAQADYARTLIAEARWLLDQGRAESAQPLLTEAHSIFERLKLEDEAQEALRLLAQSSPLA
ncbi:MAG: hypothetical protein Kow0077_03350 [Anaerolineae bacterium]